MIPPGVLVFLRVFGSLTRSLRRLRKNPDFQGLLLSVLLVLAIGTLFYSRVEGWRVLDSLYFSFITLTTIGYGDFSPQTDLGKIFTIFYVLIGLGELLGFINVVADDLRLQNQLRAANPLNPEDDGELDEIEEEDEKKSKEENEEDAEQDADDDPSKKPANKIK